MGVKNDNELFTLVEVAKKAGVKVWVAHYAIKKVLGINPKQIVGTVYLYDMAALNAVVAHVEQKNRAKLLRRKSKRKAKAGV